MKPRSIARARQIPVAFALCFTCALSAPAAAQKKGGKSVGWPFGVEAASGGMQASMMKRDLFNMGLIGAKAWDADRKEPELPRAGGRRQFRGGGDRGADVGPKRLVIKALLGGAPGQKAGLQLGDVVLGVDQVGFEKGCFAPLADALRAAEAGSGVLILKVQRGGETLHLKVKIKKGGADSKDPVRGKCRDKILKATLSWLAQRQVGDGSYPATLGGGNGQVVNSCLAGLAWIAGGSSLRGGKYRANIQKSVSFVRRGLYTKGPFAGRRGGDGGSWDQTTWAFAHAVIFFGELQVAGKSKKLQPFLQQITDELCKRQEVSGGYAHGPGGKNALGYVELDILAGFVMSGLSLAKQAGCKVDEKVVKGLSEYLKLSAGEDGGVGYAASEGQRGVGNIGRTAGAWLGAVGLGLRGDAFTGKMEQYVRAHVADIMHGHASLMQHIMLGGIAAKALGQESTDAYWKVMLRDFTLARSPDGSFQMRPWHESLLMGNNTDVSMGEVWSTASWAIVLAADNYKGKKGGLPGWCGKNPQ